MITFIFGISITNIKAQSVGINFNGSAPNTSVAFDVVINGLAGQEKGMLIPRIIQTQLLSMDALAVIAKGVYKTDGLQSRFYYNSSSTRLPNWKLLATGDTLDKTQ